MLLAPAASAAFPERLGRYEILSPIAQGGMSRVFLGRIVGPRGFERDVAIKLLREDQADASSVDPLAEAKLAAQIRHPNVVPVLDVGSAAGGLFLVMEYVEGDSLAALQRQAGDPLPVPIALKILSDALAGLEAAHELCDASGRNLGVVHRDFSPQNILVGLDGSARLSDFGIAKAAIREGETQTGIVKGKVGYMSPEQATGKRLDRRCDVWAAGVVAWELFAGQRLFPGNGDPVATAVEIVTGSPRRLCAANPAIPAEVEAAVHYALAKDLDRRCPSARAYRECLLQAWGVSPASASELGDYVRRMVGEALETRRAEVERVLALRRQATAEEASAPAASGGRPRWASVGRGTWAVLLAGAVAFALYRARAWSARADRPSPTTSESGAAPEPPQRALEPRPLTPPAGGSAPTPTVASGAEASRRTAPGGSKRAHQADLRATPARAPHDPEPRPSAPVARPAASNPYE